MKAIVCSSYGSADVLRLSELERPAPKKNEVLVRVRVAVVTPADAALRSGSPWIVRLMYGLRRPKRPVLGGLFAGIVEAVGADVTAFAPGDRVFGTSPHTLGAHAEFLSVAEDGVIAKSSDAMRDEDAVALCDGPVTALTFLRDAAQVQPGQRVLVNGASGAVGTAMVQLARHFGAEVTGVCSAANVELVRSLGATSVIDYQAEDFTAQTQRYDIVLDAIGKSSFSRCARLLAPRGQYLSTVPTLGLMASVLWSAIRRGKRARFVAAGLRQSRANLEYLRGLFDTKVLRSVIDRRFALEQIVEAFGYVETERKKGSVILEVSAPAS
jgi:NADPH:quinone reductase-like Zn-dependent oxidoreductase